MKKRADAEITPLVREFHLETQAGNVDSAKALDFFERLTALADRVSPPRRIDCWKTALYIAKVLDEAMGCPELLAHATEMHRRAELTARSFRVAEQLFGAA